MEPERPVVPSRWIRLVEYTFFLFGAIAASMLTVLTVLSEYATSLLDFLPADSLASGTVLLILGLFVLFWLFALVWTLALFFDAKRLSKADIDWSPSPILFAIGAFFTGIVALYYLGRRHEHVRMPVQFDRWWYVVAVFVGLSAVNLFAQVLFLSGFLSGVDVAATGYGLLATVITVAVPLLPMAIYRDAGHVRTIGEEWKPNPVGYFVAVTFGFLLPILPIALLASGYYLYERHRHVGLPRP